ncbi:RAMP superfamily CRISPR-associated protein [Leptolyngbya sp. AN03gr2]|uniref:RAMP superfamily CRISPR-associated protein n=1 Tax=unclassified Leptolyngbya TaxID=2650499 RepID=UPI003D31BD33
MSRKIHTRYKINGTLVAQSPIHIGSVGNDPLIDLTLAVNGVGQHYVPGTSLTGALRAWMEEIDETNTALLWGARLGRSKTSKDDDGYASWVIVEDAAIQGEVQAELRDGVGIDRLYGSAAECIKFDRAILPKGTTIQLNITIERNPVIDWEPIRLLWAELLQALTEGELRLGAAKTRGLGAVTLQNLSVQETNLQSREGILSLLKGETKHSSVFSWNDSLKRRHDQPLEIEIDWYPTAPLMVKAEQEGIAVDVLPLMSAVDNHIAFVLPGSSIKGAFRTQAERIVRTVCSIQLPEPADSKKAFLHQLDLPLINNLFGAAAKTENKQQCGQIGALAVDDCYADHELLMPQWEEVQTAKESKELIASLTSAGLPHTQQAFHVAIDRWTGGAAKNFLYSTLEPMQVKWHPIRLQVHLQRIKSKNLQKSCIALLLLVLRDLSQNRIPLGYGVNRGMGAIGVNSITLRGLDILNSDLQSSLTLQQGNLQDLEPMLTELNRAWRDWTTSYRTGNSNERA